MKYRHFLGAVEIKQVRALRRSGLPLVEIARQMGIHTATAGRMTQDMKADARAAANRKRAADNPPPWLAEARNLLSAGMTRFQISKHLGIPKTCVYRWL